MKNKQKFLISLVKDHEGERRPTWINDNIVSRRVDTRITGFFKLIKKGWF